MGLKIFGTDPANQPKPRQRFADDVVGRFRSGHMVGRTPATLSEWRVTTGDPEVADEVHTLLGGDAPQEWAATGEDKLEVFSASPSVEIILEGPKSLRQQMTTWVRGKLVFASDGETITAPDDKKGQPDPDADLTFAERKVKYNDGTGPGPEITVFFRLAANPEMGVFKFQTGSWSMVRDLAQDQTDEKLAEINGPTRATLALEPVSFEAKSGAMAGKTVSFTKPVLTILGAVEEQAAA
jgi:hypothetical protein